jgi:hypothetical protein
MTRLPLSGSFRQARLLVVGFLVFSSCTDTTPTGPSPSKIALAKGGGNGPTVKSTDPDSATVDTTLNVTVSGSGFDVGSRADWAFKGVVSEKIVTNSTQFVSSSRLVANITIAANANIGSHDVIVTTSSGKGGIGTEMFEVTVKPITDLGTLDGATESVALEVNSAGTTILGTSGQRPVRWKFINDSWMIEDLAPVIGTASSVLRELNDNGDIVGAMTVAGESHAFLLLASGQVIDLHSAPLCDGGPAEALLFTLGQDVNNRTEVVIHASPDNEANREVRGSNGYAFYWANGCITKLPALGPSSSASSINDDGIIVGYSGEPTAISPVRWTRNPDGTWAVTKLSLPSGCVSGTAVAINKTGIAAGGCRDTNTGKRLALRWSASGAVTVLPALERGDSQVNGINDAGDVAGQSVRRNGISTRAVLWPITGSITDLGAIVGTSQAWDASDRKQVVGSSQVPDGNLWPHHALLWTLP